MSLISHCSHLTSLDLSCCNSLFMSGKFLEMNGDLQILRSVLSNVKELNLASIRYLSDATFNRMVTVCSSIEKLSLASCQITFHTRAYNADRFSRFANSSVLTFKNILGFINLQASLLKSLNFSRTQIGDESLAELAATKGLQLQEMLLVSCRDVGNAGIEALCVRQPGLKLLDVSGCTDLTDSAMHSVKRNLHKIEHLNFNKVRNLTNHSLKDLFLLNKVQSVDFSSCFHLSSAALISNLCHPTMKQLSSVNISYCSSVKDDFVIKLCQDVPWLVHLNLSSCFALTNQSVGAISKHLTHLQSLNLGWCKLITDSGLLGVRSSHDEGHDEGNCRCTRKHATSNIFNKPTKNVGGKEENSVFITTVEDEDNEVYTLRNLQMLKMLDLSACPNITDEGICRAVKFRELQVLRLNMCPQLTDKSLGAIAQNVSSLEELSLSQCRLITDSGLCHLIKALPRLSALDVASCDLISDKTIHALGRYSDRLKSLDISLCQRISLAQLEVLENKLSHLQVLKRRLVGGGES